MSSLWQPDSIYTNVSNMTAYRNVADNWHLYPTPDGRKTFGPVLFYSTNPRFAAISVILVCPCKFNLHYSSMNKPLSFALSSLGTIVSRED